MSDYLHLFETQAAHDAVYNGSGYQEPWVSLVTATDKVGYNKNLLEIPLTFEATSAGTIKWKANSSNIAKAIEYKKNNDDWTSITSTTSGTSISVNSGDTVQFRGNNTTYADSSLYNYFSLTGRYKVKGNIMSLISSTDFADMKTISSTYTFKQLFYQCTTIDDIGNLILPAITLNDYCYQGMFTSCTNVTKAPKLPATTLATGCYNSMFRDCSKLITAPILSAITLNNYCYYDMFRGCTSLTETPELPAVNLAPSCYCGMFKDCTSIALIKTLPATTLANECYGSMFSGCTSLTTAPELPATTLADYCYAGMFNGCTSLTSAPELSATTLVNSCYRGMFQNCTALTTAPELPATNLVGGCYSIMFKGCSSLNYIKAMFTSDIVTYPGAYYSYTQEWLSGVASSGTFVKNSAATWNRTGVSAVPEGWTIETANA